MTKAELVEFLRRNNRAADESAVMLEQVVGSLTVSVDVRDKLFRQVAYQKFKLEV